MKKNKKDDGKKLLLIIISLILAVSVGDEGLKYYFDDVVTKNVIYNAGTITNIDSEDARNDESNLQKAISSDGDLEVYFFSVGQADCILISNSGENMLIDAGNNKDGVLIVNQLKKMDIDKINYLVGTHAHEDHIGGLDDVINNFEIEKIFMSRKTTNTKTYEDVLTAISNEKLKISVPKIGDVFYLGNAKCEIMGIENDAEDLNETSIIIQLSYGENKFLFTGDAETTNEEERSWEDIDLLKVAHHGSRTSSSESFLSQTKPEYAVISVGLNNDYNHPHAETINRLKGIEIYRTDKDGTILAISDGKNISIEKLDINLDGNN